MKKPQPVAPKNVSRLLIVMIVILALAAGYFQALFEAEQRKYNRLEDMYVRVRSQLGVEETNRLIQQSYE